jgi:hypothetical protein
MNISAFEPLSDMDLKILRPHYVSWMARWRWTHFITLATNDHDQRLSPDAMCRLLKSWDARMNRRLIGPKWAKRPDERLFAFYFLEKCVVNPHWHGLVMLDEPDRMKRGTQSLLLRLDAESVWKKLNRSGSVDVQAVDESDGVRRYVAKGLADEIQYSSIVVPRGFDLQ